jgi:hypothetical protein
MVKYLSFHNSSSFALTYLWMWMARPQCDTPLVLCIWTPRNAFFQVCLFVRCAEWARKKTKLLCNFGRRWVGNFEVCFVKFSFFFFFLFDKESLYLCTLANTFMRYTWWTFSIYFQYVEICNISKLGMLGPFFPLPDCFGKKVSIIQF